MDIIKHDLTYILKAVILGLIIVVGINFAYAQWVGPTQAPPGGNTPPPINTGSTFQQKSGDLWVRSLGSDNGIITFGSIGVGTSNPTQKIDVVGAVKGTQLCIGSDCRSAWPVIPPPPPPPKSLGSYEARIAGGAGYTAATDGFVVVTSNQAAVSTLVVRTDDTNSIGYVNRGVFGVGSITVPVTAGSRWVVNTIPTNTGLANLSVWWVPLD